VREKFEVLFWEKTVLEVYTTHMTLFGEHEDTR
jgi:hypothetical protein